MTEQKKVENPEFMYLPLESIIVEEQIRSGIDTESESFKALMESIIERGVLNSVSHNGGKGFKGSRVQVKIKSVHSSQFTVHGKPASSIQHSDCVSWCLFTFFPPPLRSTLSALRSSSHGSGERGIGIYSGTTSRQRI